jgi:hypothetical protein
MPGASTYDWTADPDCILRADLEEDEKATVQSQQKMSETQPKMFALIWQRTRSTDAAKSGQTSQMLLNKLPQCSSRQGFLENHKVVSGPVPKHRYCWGGTRGRGTASLRGSARSLRGSARSLRHSNKNNTITLRKAVYASNVSIRSEACLALVNISNTAYYCIILSDYSKTFIAILAGPMLFVAAISPLAILSGHFSFCSAQGVTLTIL